MLFYSIWICECIPNLVSLALNISEIRLKAHISKWIFYNIMKIGERSSYELDLPMKYRGY